MSQFFYELIGKPLSYPFMQNAVLAVILIGIVAGVIGSYVVVKGMAFFSDALAHAVLPGVAVAYLIGGTKGPLFEGAFIMGIISAGIIGFLTRGGRLKEDTAIGVVFTTMLALGIGIMSLGRSYAVDLTHILIGNILSVNSNDLAAIAATSLFVVLMVILFYKELLLTTFDPMLAQTLRLPAEALRYLLLMLMALTIVISIQAVGVVLIAALLVTPAATAFMLTRRLAVMMIIASIIGVVGGVVGIFAAWHFNVAPSAAMVITISAAFLTVFLFAPQRGLFTRARQRA